MKRQRPDLPWFSSSTKPFVHSVRIARAAAVSAQQTVGMLAAAPALVDESFRRCPDGRGLFLLAAVAVPDDGQAAAERWLRGTVAPGQRRWHFRDESAASRRRFIAVLAEREMSGVQALTFCGWTNWNRRCGYRTRSPAPLG